MEPVRLKKGCIGIQYCHAKSASVRSEVGYTNGIQLNNMKVVIEAGAIDDPVLFEALLHTTSLVCASTMNVQ